jgi:hypothetical protein
MRRLGCSAEAASLWVLHRTAVAGLLAAAAVVAAPGRCLAAAAAAPSVWVVDDGEKIRRDAVSTPFERGEDNPVWRPGAPVRLLAVRDEWVAFQVVVEAGDAPVEAATVELGPLARRRDTADRNHAYDLDSADRNHAYDLDPAADGNAGGAGALTHIDRFVEHFVIVRRPSGGRTPGESLGWEAGAAPPHAAWVGPVPDALIPVEHAPPWAPYPLQVEPRSNAVVWIDLFVPPAQPPGLYRGALAVRAAGGPLASIPVELEVADATLPERMPGATAFYDPDELARRVGPAAERELWKLMHAHRVAPLHDATSVDDVARQRDALDGSLYTAAGGYVGPAVAVGDGVLSLGAYGAFGDADPTKLARVEAVADAAAAAQAQRGADVFLYADDERCESDRAAVWRRWLDRSLDANARRVRVGWTCSSDPSEQPADVVMLLARYDRAQVERARERGKEVWVYNGVLPRSGTFLLDADAVSPRVNGWLAALDRIPHWFYWESTFWYGVHGATPMDPFVEPESMHNADGDWANGDGVLVYPGRQLDLPGARSLGWDGVVPSIRLKNWRRGLQDGGYLELARRRDAARADATARWLLPAAFDDAARSGRSPSWSSRGARFFEARRALLAIALAEPVAPLPPRPDARPAPRPVVSRRLFRLAIAGGAAILLAAAWTLARLRRRAGRSGSA